MQLLGVDFSSAPTRRKPITVARGQLVGAVLRLNALDEMPTMAGFEALLREPGPWLGGFDFPFGLPRAFVDAQGLGSTTADVITELQRRCPARMDFRALVDAWGNTRAAGQRLLHRVCDGAMPGISNSEGGSASAGTSMMALATSTGFRGSSRGSGFSVSAVVVAGTTVV
jgi:hypothetical protein